MASERGQASVGAVSEKVGRLIADRWGEPSVEWAARVHSLALAATGGAGRDARRGDPDGLLRRRADAGSRKDGLGLGGRVGGPYF